MLITYTAAKGSCVDDYVFWFRGTVSAAKKSAPAFDALVQDFISEEHPR